MSILNYRYDNTPYFTAFCYKWTFTMLRKSTLFTLILLCSSSSLYANVPIESRGLSYETDNTPLSTTTAINIPNTQVETVPTSINWQLTQKTQQLENDIRVLRGKIEEQDNQINQLTNELNNRYTDLDQRLELLLQKVDSDNSDTTLEEDNQQDITPSIKSTEPTTNKPVTPSPTATASVTTVQKASSNTELDKAAYTVALEAYKQGGAKKALAPMQNFIKNNPNSVYISNAYFWVGEFYLAIEPTNYVAAKKNFEIVANKYPNSSKAANALHRLYNISLNVDHNPTQANKYKTLLLQKYPKSEEAGFLKK